jgi:YgiT-type zinc finger domain-containing protein
MDSALQEPTWEALSGEMLSGMREWRLQHPKATLREIEAALDEHWYRLRARMLHDLALHSAATNWKDAPATERPVCPACEASLVLRGTRPRQLKTYGGQTLALDRSYGVCPRCHQGVFPPR